MIVVIVHIELGGQNDFLQVILAGGFFGISSARAEIGDCYRREKRKQRDDAEKLFKRETALSAA